VERVVLKVAADAETRDKWVSALQDAMSIAGHSRDVKRWSISGWYSTASL